MKFLEEEKPKSTLRLDDEMLLSDQVNEGTELSYNLLNLVPRVQKRSFSRLYLSSITTACAREEAIGHLLGMKKSKKFFAANQLMMDMGSAVHFYIQNNPDHFFGKDKFLGNWKCLACGRMRRFGVKPTSPCEFCNASVQATVYSEYHFRLDKPYRVSGKVDGILDVGQGKFRFLDIKTYGAKAELTHPEGDHVAQVAAYMFFHQFDNEQNKIPIEIDQEYGYVMYFMKTMNMRAPVKTFKVQPTERMLDPLTAKAEQYSIAAQTGVLPSCLNLCVTGNWNSTRAKGCSMAKYCQAYYEQDVTQLVPS